MCPKRLRRDRKMALRLRNRRVGSGSSSIGSVEGSKVRWIHADNVFVGHYSPRVNSIKLLLRLTPSHLRCWKPPPLLLSLFIQPFTKNSLNRWTTHRWRLMPGQWMEWEQTTFGLFSGAKTSYKILNSCWRRFSYSWQATRGSNALFVANTLKYSIPVSLWSGQCCGSSSVAMPCVSLRQAGWISPAKVIALLRCKYSTSHTPRKDKDFCFLPRNLAQKMIHVFGGQYMSPYHLCTKTAAVLKIHWQGKCEDKEWKWPKERVNWINIYTVGKQTPHTSKHSVDSLIFSPLWTLFRSHKWST